MWLGSGDSDAPNCTDCLSRKRALITPPIAGVNCSEFERGVACDELIAVNKIAVASAIDDNGGQLFPRRWNDDFIDSPLVS